jgi:uncharacterized protein (DUF2236 family)
VFGALDPEAPAPFGRRSIVRAMVAEPVTALLVQRALVMEVAHPAVAAGVVHHSSFQRRPLTRAWVTADAALRLVFGSDSVARGAAQQIYRVHDHINGPLSADDDGADDADGGDGAAAYTAHDARLLAWVWATLVDSAETAFTRWVRPLSDTEADDFYGEMLGFARFFGIPATELPADRARFAEYLDAMLEDPTYGTGEASRAMARQVLWFRHRTVPSPVVRLQRTLALTTLDRRVLEHLAIEPAPSDEAFGRRVDGWLRAYYRRLPRTPAAVPALYVRVREPGWAVARRLRTLWEGAGR